MTQITQNEKGAGNTIVQPQRSRNWCFTLNNYTKKEITQFIEIKFDTNINKFCFQEEKGENNVPHLQGVLAFKNAISFNCVKKLSPKAHWEQCRNLKRSLAYCSKADTRNGKTYTYQYEVFNDGKELTESQILNYLREKALKNMLETIK